MPRCAIATRKYAEVSALQGIVADAPLQFERKGDDKAQNDGDRRECELVPRSCLKNESEQAICQVRGISVFARKGAIM
jgi:hypothetical protein